MEAQIIGDIYIYRTKEGAETEITEQEYLNLPPMPVGDLAYKTPLFNTPTGRLGVDDWTVIDGELINGADIQWP